MIIRGLDMDEETLIGEAFWKANEEQYIKVNYYKKYISGIQFRHKWMAE